MIPVFVLDPTLTFAAPGRVSFLLDCLTGLRAGLRQRGGDLLIRHGDPVAEVIRPARSHHAEEIILAADVSRYAQRRYQRLAAACQQHRLTLREADGLTVVPPGAIVPSGGDHYRVFTPYWRAWSTCGWRRPLPAPKHVAVPPSIDAGVFPRREDVTRRPLAASLPRGGETAARRRTTLWLDTGLACYPGRHDDLAAAATSRLSADLLGEPVRFNGGHSRCRFLTDELGSHVHWVPFCPEIAIGLGSPRATLTADHRGTAGQPRRHRR